MTSRVRRRGWIHQLCLAVLPIIYFYDWLFPIDGHYTRAGNDFANLYYPYKLYLLDALVRFRLPLWSPSEGAGFPFYANPFAQAFYPLNVPLAAFYALAGGYTMLDHQWFSVLAISIFAVGTYRWLERLVQNPRALMFGVAVASISFRMSELLRFPNALHAAAWYPWILLTLTGIFDSPSLWRSVRSGFGLFTALLMLMTAGYPYYIYYAPFFIVPYAAALAAGLLAGRPAPDARRLCRFVIVSAGAAMSALLLVGPYLYKMWQVLASTTDRDGKSYEYSTAHVFDFNDTIGSVLYPPSSQTEGVYYFGMLGLFLILYSLVRSRRDTAAWLATGWFAVITLITHGRESALFDWLWYHLPGFSSLRVWGRLNVVLVPFIAWVLAVAYGQFEDRLIGVHRAKPVGELVFAGIAISLVLLQIHLHLAGARDPYWQYFPWNEPKVVYFLIAGVASAAVLSLLLFVTRRRKVAPHRLPFLLAGAMVFTVLDVRPVGSSLWIVHDAVETRYRLDVEALNRQSFDVPRRDTPGFISLNAAFNAGVPENWYYGRFVNLYRELEAQPAERAALLGFVDGRKLFFTRRIGHSDVSAFLADSAAVPSVLRVVTYDGDHLKVVVRASEPGWLSFIDNWDPDWQATVDGRPAPLIRLFGTFKSVPVPEGKHRVELRYVPTLRSWRQR